MNSSVAPLLRPCMHIVAETGTYLPLQQRDDEKLEFIPITGGSVSGDATGEIIPGGGDWCLTRADASYQVEARYLFRTDSGDVVDVVNVGVLRHLPGGRGGSREMGYFLTTPRFRTAAPALQWLTRSVFVGRAFVNENDTTIDVFEVLA